MFRGALALLHCELGREAQARAEFEEVAEGDFASIPFDNEWLLSMSLLSEVAHVLRDEPRAAALYERLLPYADRNALGSIEGCTGSVSRCLGLLAAVMSRWDEAAHHFEQSLERNARMGARPWVARTQYDFAAMLMQRGSPDGGRSTDLLAEALRTCDELGMPALGGKVTAALDHLGARLSTAHIDDRDQGQPSVEDGTVRLEGEYWAVGYAGRTLRFRDSKGLRILARLLADSGRPFAALDLERLDAPGDEATARAIASGDAGELLDETARNAYRARRDELREAIADADAEGNTDRAGALREEMDFVAHELGRALGLGGRSRRAGSIAERARLNVTRAIRSAMRRIAAADAELATHLEATIHTGAVCVYSPDPRAPIGWRVSVEPVHRG
jgi:tetratricopeptide (TPR) repeat protein